jgi:hypothetical protein
MTVADLSFTAAHHRVGYRQEESVPSMVYCLKHKVGRPLEVHMLTDTVRIAYRHEQACITEPRGLQKSVERRAKDHVRATAPSSN